MGSAAESSTVLRLTLGPGRRDLRCIRGLASSSTPGATIQYNRSTVRVASASDVDCHWHGAHRFVTVASGPRHGIWGRRATKLSIKPQAAQQGIHYGGCPYAEIACAVYSPAAVPDV